MSERKREKPSFALPSDYFHFPINNQQPLDESHHDSVGFKYASSIYEIVTEDKLESSTNNLCRYEESLVTSFHASPRGSHKQSNSNIQPTIISVGSMVKNKKKNHNKVALAYNFSNITILSRLLEKIFKNRSRNTFKSIYSYTCEELPRLKLEKIRSSMHSGCTTSTSPISSEEDLKKKHQGIDLIKGWINYQLLMNINSSFSSIKHFRYTHNHTPITHHTPTLYSIPSPLKGQHYYPSESHIEHSVSINQDIRKFEESLTYTVDNDSPESKARLSRLFREDRSLFGNSSKIVETNNPKESQVEAYKEYMAMEPPKHLPPKAQKQPETFILKPSMFKKRLPLCEERRSVEVYTNTYELPLLRDDFASEFAVNLKLKPTLNDIFSLSQPEICENVHNITSGLYTMVSNRLGSSSSSHNAREVYASGKNSSNAYSNLQAYSKNSNNIFDNTLDSEGKKITNKLGINLTNTQNEERQARSKNFTTHQEVEYLPFTEPLENPSHDLQQTKQLFLQSALKSKISHENSTAQKKNVRYEESIITGITNFNANEFKTETSEFKFPTKREYLPQNSNSRDNSVGRDRMERGNSNSKSIERVMLNRPSPGKQLKLHHINSHSNSIKKTHLVQARPESIISMSPITHQQPYMSPQPISPQHQLLISPRNQNKARSPLQLNNKINSPRSPLQLNNPVKNEAYNIYQLNQAVVQPKEHPKQAPRTIEQQYLQRPGSRNLVNRLFEPTPATPMKTSQDKGLTLVSKKDESIKKYQVYSPQVHREYPISPMHQQGHIHKPHLEARPSQEYMIGQNIQSPRKAVNINNQYYISGPEAFKKPEPTYIQPQNIFAESQPSTRSETDRMNIFAYPEHMREPLRPSSHTSDRGSMISRPKSSNEKIMITLKR